jgi:hypothetical protein
MVNLFIPTMKTWYVSRKVGGRVSRQENQEEANAGL